MCCKTDENVLVQMTDELKVTITLKEYREMVEKAARLDAIADSIRQCVNEGKDKYGRVNDDIVLMMTGTYNYHKPVQPENPEEKDE